MVRVLVAVLSSGWHEVPANGVSGNFSSFDPRIDAIPKKLATKAVDRWHYIEPSTLRPSLLQEKGGYRHVVNPLSHLAFGIVHGVCRCRRNVRRHSRIRSNLNL